jgi:ABC-type branched-subunit amino acid transport system substrate-binding protein
VRAARWQLGAAVLLAGSVALTACGSDDDSGSSGSGGDGGDAVKIMLIYDETGPGASPELVDGATAGVDEVNANGGVNGNDIELLTCETGNDPNKADNCSREAVKEGVVAVVGELTLQKGHEEILRNEKIPIVGAVTSGSDLTEPAQFPITGSTAIEIPGLANAFADAGATKISLARIQVDGGEAFAGFANGGLKNRGLEINNDVPIPTGAPDMAPYVEQVLAGGTDAIMSILPGSDSTAFVKELKKIAPDVPVALIGTQKEKVVDALGADSEGLMESMFFLPPSYENEATKAYVQAMSDAGFDETRGFRLHAYTAVQVFAKVASGVEGKLDHQSMWDALSKSEGVDVGLTPPLQWTEGGVGGLDRVFTSCSFIVTIQDGKEVGVNDTFKDAYTGEDCPTPAKS